MICFLFSNSKNKQRFSAKKARKAQDVLSLACVCQESSCNVMEKPSRAGVSVPLFCSFQRNYLDLDLD